VPAAAEVHRYTDSNHNLAVYPNLGATLVVTRVDQLWVADITYIRLEVEFVYLAMILDAFSRREIGWALDRMLEVSLTLEALRMALRRRRPAPGLVHHSDQGVQYAASDYVDLLATNGIRITMSRRGNPYYNATCESFIRSACFWRRFITRNACTRRWATCRPSSSRRNSQDKRRLLRSSFLCEFLRHEQSIDPIFERKTLRTEVRLRPQCSSASMSCSWLFLGGLLSSRARLRFTNRRPACDTHVLPVENFSANGKQCLIRLSQARGPLGDEVSPFHPSSSKSNECKWEAVTSWDILSKSVLN
jgi:transposase InsO family protein